MPRFVHIAVITKNDTCTITFCASLLKLQVQLARSPDVTASIHFYASLDEALKEFEHKGEDTLVIAHSHMGIPEAFFLEDPQYDCIISPYPLPKIDWERVQKKLTQPENAEAPEHVGNVYNFDPAAASTISSRFLKVPRQAVSEFGVCKLRKGVSLHTIQEVHVDLSLPSVNHGLVAYSGCVGIRKQLRV